MVVKEVLLLFGGLFVAVRLEVRFSVKKTFDFLSKDLGGANSVFAGDDVDGGVGTEFVDSFEAFGDCRGDFGEDLCAHGGSHEVRFEKLVENVWRGGDNAGEVADLGCRTFVGKNVDGVVIMGVEGVD